MSARKKDETFADYRVRRTAEKLATAVALKGTVIWQSSKQGTYTKQAGAIGTVYMTGKQKRAAKRAQAGA